MSELWHILLVEDDDYLNQSIVNSLRKDGYIVQGVKSGAEAIRLVWSEEYDVVIGDLRTPGADGFEMLQWLRSFRPKTRMIMVAASASAADRTQALEAGVVSYLSKPLDLHQLKEELRRWVAKEIGALAKPDDIRFSDVLPKTRSGKIMRRLLRELASSGEVKGDVTTLEDLSVIARLSNAEG